MKFSIELEILIESIKTSLLGESPEKLQAILKNNQIDWQKFIPFVEYHSIRPVVFDAFQKMDKSLIPSEIARYLQEYMFNQTILNLNYSLEIGRLLQLFQAKGLRALPYKGNLFIHQFYGNKQLREVGDMDFLFHPEDAKAGLKLLLDDGYQLSVPDESFARKLDPNALINKILTSKGQYEVTLVKRTKENNMQFAIDFHWEIYADFIPYKVDFERFFTTTTQQSFLGKNIDMPSTETLYFMLMSHHGGKEFWLRMKHFCDLIMFLKIHQQSFNWQKIIDSSQKNKLNTVSMDGFYLLKKLFNVSLPAPIQEEVNKHNFKKVEKKIFQYWELGEKWDTLFLRLRYEEILILSQDNGFSRKKYFKSLFQVFSTSHPLENPRIISFPDNYPILNFSSKVLTYFIKKFRNKP